MNTTSQLTDLQQFIRTHCLKMSATRTDSNPSMDGSFRMDHWACVIRKGSKSFRVVFSMGSGHHGAAPKLEDVLDCMASDASGAETAGSFEEWCSEYGYDTDSRKAEKTYSAITKQAVRLQSFLGHDNYTHLLFGTERL